MPSAASRPVKHAGLVDACRLEDADAIKHELEQYDDLNVRDPAQRTLLMAMCELGPKGMVRQLLQYKADPNLEDADGIRALALAIRQPEEPEIIAWLIEWGAVPDAADASGKTPLHRACEKNAPLAAELLLNAGADPRRTSADGLAPLTIARQHANGDTPLTQLLQRHTSTTTATSQSARRLARPLGRPSSTAVAAPRCRSTQRRAATASSSRARRVKVALRPVNLLAPFEPAGRRRVQHRRRLRPSRHLLRRRRRRRRRRQLLRHRRRLRARHPQPTKPLRQAHRCKCPQGLQHPHQVVPRGGGGGGAKTAAAAVSPPASPILERQPRSVTPSSGSHAVISSATPPHGLRIQSSEDVDARGDADGAEEISSPKLEQQPPPTPARGADTEEIGSPKLEQQPRPTLARNDDETEEIPDQRSSCSARGSSSSSSRSSSRSRSSSAAENDGGGESDAAGGVVLPPSAAAETASAALLTEDITVLESWLRKGGDVDAPLDADGTTLLMSAAATTNHPALEVLLQQPGAQVNRQRAADGCTALLCSIQGLAPRAQRAGGIPGGKLTSDDLVPVKLLLNAAADPDIAAFKGRVPYAVSPLLLATQLNATQIVSMLLEARASTDHPDDAVPRPLIVACANNHVSLVQLLLQHGARSEPPELGATALTISCELGDTSKGIVEVLLAHNASPNRADACGNTPLMWAAEANAPDVAEILLNAGACPRRVNAAGDAALNIALKHAEQGAPTPLVDIPTGTPRCRPRRCSSGASSCAASPAGRSSTAVAAPRCRSTRRRAATASSSRARRVRRSRCGLHRCGR